MRKALAGLERYVATVLVSKHRFFVWLPQQVLPAARLIVFARDDDYFFGVLNLRYRLVAIMEETAPISIPSISCIPNSFQ